MSHESLIVPTVGEIAKRLGEPIHRIEYVIRTRQIYPVGKAGNTLIYTDADVLRIKSELNVMDARRATGGDHV